MNKITYGYAHYNETGVPGILITLYNTSSVAQRDLITALKG
jgi:hypothetical protein